MAPLSEHALVSESGCTYECDSREAVEAHIAALTCRLRNPHTTPDARALLEADRDLLLDMHYLMTPASTEEQ